MMQSRKETEEVKSLDASRQQEEQPINRSQAEVTRQGNRRICSKSSPGKAVGRSPSVSHRCRSFPCLVAQTRETLKWISVHKEQETEVFRLQLTKNLWYFQNNRRQAKGWHKNHRTVCFLHSWRENWREEVAAVSTLSLNMPQNILGFIRDIGFYHLLSLVT